MSMSVRHAVVPHMRPPPPKPLLAHAGFGEARYFGVSPRLKAHGSSLDVTMTRKARDSGDMAPFLDLELAGARSVKVRFRTGETALAQAKQLETALRDAHNTVSRTGTTVTVTRHLATGHAGGRQQQPPRV